MRERCIGLAELLIGEHRYLESELKLIEAFAREIRNEALEDAANVCVVNGFGFDGQKAIRALKEHAEQATEEYDDLYG